MKMLKLSYLVLTMFCGSQVTASSQEISNSELRYAVEVFGSLGGIPRGPIYVNRVVSEGYRERAIKLLEFGPFNKWPYASDLKRHLRAWLGGEDVSSSLGFFIVVESAVISVAAERMLNSQHSQYCIQQMEARNEQRYN